MRYEDIVVYILAVGPEGRTQHVPQARVTTLALMLLAPATVKGA